MAKAKKQLEREWKYVIEPFGHRLKVILTDDVHASYEGLDVNTSEKLHTDVAACVVFTSADDGLTWMLLNFNSGPGTIAHESWHVVQRMLLGLGAGLDNETVAYHLGDLVRKITEFQLDTRTKLRLHRRKK